MPVFGRCWAGTTGPTPRAHSSASYTYMNAEQVAECGMQLQLFCLHFLFVSELRSQTRLFAGQGTSRAHHLAGEQRGAGGHEANTRIHASKANTAEGPLLRDLLCTGLPHTNTPSQRPQRPQRDRGRCARPFGHSHRRPGDSRVTRGTKNRRTSQSQSRPPDPGHQPHRNQSPAVAGRQATQRC